MSFSTYSHGLVGQPSIEELALELAQLQQTRPPKPIATTENYNTDRHRKEVEKHWSHTMTEHDLRQEIYRRIGGENGDQLIIKMQNVLKLMT